MDRDNSVIRIMSKWKDGVWKEISQNIAVKSDKWKE